MINYSARTGRPYLTYEDADLPKIYQTVTRLAGRQLQGANRIDEIQLSQETHDARFDALDARLDRLEAKLDTLIAAMGARTGSTTGD